jgi:multidrug efflux pump
MANFFIRRPIFAWVLAIILMMAGALAILQLPVAQYPTIAPPAVSVSANYPGADAQTVQDTVTQVIEQNMNGIDNLMYMSSTSDSAGSVTITLTFQSGTDPDIAQVQVQNKLQLATPLLPQEVQQQGISVEKSSSSYLMVAGFVSDNPGTTQDDISDYVASNVKDTLSRLNGVGDVQLFGAQYAMRIWLDADLLNKYKLTPVDVINQLKVQNDQIAAGQLGGTPALPGQQLNASIIAQTRFKNPEEFGKVTLRVNSDGSVVRLKDVARVELGGENYNVIARINGKPAAGLGIKLATGANALDTAKAIKAKLAELQPFFPQGMKVLYPYDTTPFVQLSIHEVVKTLFEAIMLVFLVMYLFLQNMRATLIPTIAVPVVLLGTFAILAAFGYSINTLTMFGMVLAIGLLVDDAIVVVENVERVMMEDKLPPKEATEKSMSQIQGALVGIAMVLSAVFIPMAFFGGSTGAIYRQFSITIVSAMALSVLVALILTPALCATLLKPVSAEHHENKGGFFGWFNTTFDHSVNHYTNSVGKILGSTGRYLLIYALIVAGMVVLFLRLPSSFLPEEDQGVFLTMIQLPAGATQERTQKVLDQVTDYYLKNEKANVESVFTVNGFSFSGQAQNAGMAFVSLKPWEERKSSGMKVEDVMADARREFYYYPEAKSYVNRPPVIPGLGESGGLEMQLEAKGDASWDNLVSATDTFLYYASQAPELQGVSSAMQSEIPQLYFDVDRDQAKFLGIPLSDIFSTMKAYLGSVYVNDFNMFNRIYRVYIQAEAPYRATRDNLDLFFVRSKDGAMVPLTALGTTQYTTGPGTIKRFNMFTTASINAVAAPGYSTGEAMAAMERIAREHLPENIGLEWSGLSYQEKQAGGQTGFVLALVFLFVFLFLAAQYESWIVPIAVLLSLPVATLGAYLGIWATGLENDIYYQIGLVTLIGLAAKNAILIVEFAKVQVDNGVDVVRAAIHAAQMRFRPILMTSLAFVLGMLPMVLASGPGSASRHSIGTGVFFGMLVAITVGIVLVPFFFVLIYKIKGKMRMERIAQKKEVVTSILKRHKNGKL